MALGDVIARLSVQLGMETAAFEKGANLAEKRMAQTKRKFQALGRQMSGIGKGIAIGITAPLAAIGVSAAKAAIASKDAIGQMEATLKSMGDGAGRSSEQLQVLAKDLEGISEYDDKQILREVTSNMLTFGDVAGENFDRANRAAVNLSAKLGQDLKSSTILIGKALNDPVKGLSALSRVGVKLAPEQEELAKKMAKAGDVAGAQAIILAELEKQYEGSAQAVRDAAPGSDTINKWSDLQEKLGALVLTVLDAVTPALNAIIDAFLGLSPEMQKTIAITAAVVAALGPLLIIAGSITSAIGTLLPVLAKLGTMFKVLRVVSLALMGNPIILAFAGVLAGIYLAWKNWDKIVAIVQRLYAGVKTWLQDRLGAVFDWVRKKIRQVEETFAWLWDRVVGNSWVPDMVDAIGQNMARLQGLMVDPAQKATRTTEQYFRDMASNVSGLLDRLFPEIARLQQLRDDLATIDSKGKDGKYLLDETTREAAAQRARRSARTGSIEREDVPYLTKLEPIAIDLPRVMKRVEKELEPVLKRVGDQAEITTVRIAESFKDMADKTLSSLRGLVDGIKSGDFLSIFEGILNFVLQLGSTGVFGKDFAARINRPPPVPAYAKGTSFHPGGLALVGERGMELVDMPRGSRVYTNSDTRRMMSGGEIRVHVEASPYFDARVQQNVAQASPSIMDGGARVANSRLSRRSTRRIA